MNAAALTWLLFAPARATSPMLPCAAEGERAAEQQRWHDAITHYLEAADDVACRPWRAIHLHNAAIAAQQLGRAGSDADRCAAAEYFERVLAASPAAPLAESARAGLAAALHHCPLDRVPWQPPPVGAGPASSPGSDAPPPAVGLPTAADLATVPPPTPASTPDKLVTHVPAAPSQIPWVVTSGIALAGAGVAGWFLWDADGKRDAALATARASEDPAVWRAERIRHDDANTQSTAAAAVMWGLLAAGAGFGARAIHGWLSEEPLTDETFTAQISNERAR